MWKPKVTWLRIGLAAFMLYLAPAASFAQDKATYQVPPKAIADLVDAPNTPSISFSRDGEMMLVLERAGNPSIEDLAQPELRIAGIRINPATTGPSRTGGVENFKIRKTRSGDEIQVKGLPAKPKLSGFSFSKDEKFLSFYHTEADGVTLWVVDMVTYEAKQLGDLKVNMVYGNATTWTPENTIIVKAVNPKRGTMPQAPLAPVGPNVQETSGNAAPSRTYQDLLTNPYEEDLFAYFMDSQLMEVMLDGSQKPVGAPGMIKGMSLSPDGKFLMVDRIQRPFSYLVPASRFPYDVEVLDRTGKQVKLITSRPLDEVRPTGFDATVEGPRSISWRADKGATLYWVEAQDGGDPRKQMEEREIIYTWDAPFNGEKQKLAAIGYRFGGITWSEDKNFALLSERWFASRQERVSVINPENPAQKPRVIIERSSDDIYNDPGSPVTKTNEFGRSVLLKKGDDVFMTSEGGSPDGSYPFLSAFNVKKKEQKILWRSEAPFYERVVRVLNADATEFITLKESTELQPNYWLVNTKRRIAPMQLTDFENPYAAIAGIQKELVTYSRKDGLNLSAVIYTPEGYDAERDGPLPVVMWAYPREYKSAEVAAQVRGSKHTFTRLSWGSPLYWVTQGYAIMDRTEMPIVGEGEIEPNDSFVEQLVANAEAAIDYIVERGIGDRNRIAVGGHSYGPL
ncbi:peptidase S9 prolyl oligopeptidase active site domain-containing protein [Nitritalea halalkaliphila LW7]|uniref:Peptidase S9 prolyl oligopeptidase active site domain-containing protein n=1 Tax=Nitritalea halalkaliphila LW7 TaxID=1189621 RepID=I5C5F3_9BACT|nr:peptidase S9 prolyl oligopeptidase active site domain-containing protein [Nitritalea halalkaliphila]EIM77055.1 peptidase S9 prolyl oligopeptidase active site domain-containing protein [Nitritalea halalkaliphila LW7]